MVGPRGPTNDMFRHAGYGNYWNEPAAADDIDSSPMPPPSRPPAHLAIPIGNGHPAMSRGRVMLSARDLALIDVRYDGSCVVWSALRAISGAVGRTVGEEEARNILVAAMATPELRADLEQDLRQTNAEYVAAGHPALPDTTALLAEFAQPNAYLNPILTARALEKITGGGRIIVHTIDATGDLVPLFESDGDAPYTCQMFYEPSIAHMALVLPLPRRLPPTESERPEAAAPTDDSDLA